MLQHPGPNGKELGKTREGVKGAERNLNATGSTGRIFRAGRDWKNKPNRKCEKERFLVEKPREVLRHTDGLNVNERLSGEVLKINGER